MTYLFITFSNPLERTSPVALVHTASAASSCTTPDWWVRRCRLYSKFFKPCLFPHIITYPYFVS